MEIREDKYLAGDYQGNLFIKIVGNATMKNSKTLDALFDKVFAGGQKDIILDFEECNYMDSTMLGLIAKTAIKLKKLWGKSMYSVNASNVIAMSLKSTGVDKLLVQLETTELAVIGVEKLDNKDFEGKREKTEHILEAHKTLMELSEENSAVFKNVVTLLEQELKK